MSEELTKFNFQLKKDTLEQLQRYAKDKEVSAADVVRGLIRELLAKEAIQ